MSALNQLIAQSRGPDLLGARGSAMQQLSAMQGIRGQKLQNQAAEAQISAASRSFEQDAKDRQMRVIANTALQLDKLAPEQRAAAYQTAKRQAELYWDGDPWPEEYSPEVQGLMDFAKSQVYGGQEQDGFTLKPGEQRFDAAGNQVASVAPKTPDRPDFTLGNRRYDAAGNLITQAPSELVEVTNPDGSKRLAPESVDLQTEPAEKEPEKLDLTPAEKAVDKAFAKDYNEFVATGGLADVEKQLSQLEQVQRYLEDPDTFAATGGLIGLTPKFLRDIIPGLEQGAAAQDAVEEVVQRNLRLVLGAQFTQKEGERLIERAYNPRQSEEQNAIRVGRLVEQIRGAAKAKMAAAQYYEQNGTLRGFKGKTKFTMDDFGAPESDYADGTVIQNAAGERMVMQGGEWMPLEQAVGGATGNY